LESNADANHIIETGDSVLQIAVSNNSIDIVKMLLEKGANPISSNKEGKGIIEIALKHSNSDIYTILLEEVKKRNQKENDIVKELVAENVTSGKKKKRRENPVEEERKAILMNVINSMELHKKDKKSLKTDFLNKNRKYPYCPNIQMPFSFNKSKTNMYISI
jgi:ankyrin repeat protein